jgi:2-oxoglutarate dehydrogenase E2 component (dihydrolipoamide succinyltransferase)
MSTEIKVPVLPESVADATIATWHKKPGEACSRDENLVDIETDKVVLEVVAPDDGVLEEILCQEGETVTAEQVIAKFKAGASAASAPQSDSKPVEDKSQAESANASSDENNAASSDVLSPAVRRLINEHGLDPNQIPASGKGGRLTKEDVENFIKSGKTKPSVSSSPTTAPTSLTAGPREEKRVPMTRLRKRIAERLVEAQHTAAILTTFNDVNMKPVMDLRAKYKDQFLNTHGVKLGFMSFFVKATVEALKRYPAVNASIDGDDIVYHGYFDIGIAVSAPRGLVVPVIRDADQLSMAEIEKTIIEFGQKAQNNQLTVDDLSGGTFTVSNGGTFGSLMSTPIINPPQSGILGMHRIEQRPVVENGEIVVRPMMYLAFSYDHRIIDGRESVGFLKTIKDYIEDPARILLEL